MAATSPACTLCEFAGALAAAALLAARLAVAAWLQAAVSASAEPAAVAGDKVAAAAAAGSGGGARSLSLAVALARAAGRSRAVLAAAAAQPDADEPPAGADSFFARLWPARASAGACAAACALAALAVLGARLALLRCGHHHAWVMRRPGYLSTVCAPGRLGNRLFHTLAVSLLAERYDLATEYEDEALFARLGLPLAAGSRYMVDGPAALLDEERWAALMAAPPAPGAPLRLRLQIPPLAYFQTPAFARAARALLQAPRTQRALLAANPWRDRVRANDDVFVHVRLGDLDHTAPHFTRPPSHFVAAVANATAADAGGAAARGRVYVASDEPDRREVAAVADAFGGEVLRLDVVATWQFGATCKHLVLSDSTFSWAVAAMHAAQPGSSVRILPRFGPRWMAGDVFETFEDWQVIRGD